MAYKYLSISFLGTYSNMIKFFDTKGWTYEIKNVGHNKLLLKVSEELTEEIQFFKNSVLDEVSQEKILAVRKNFYLKGEHHLRGRVYQDQ